MLRLDKMLENDCSYICFLDSLTIHVWKTVVFLFHKYSRVKTDAWVCLEYLVESIIWEIVFPQQRRVIDVKKWGSIPQDLHTAAQMQSCAGEEVIAHWYRIQQTVHKPKLLK